MDLSTVDKRPLKVFLCHSSNDKGVVRGLYSRLSRSGIQPWLDEADLLPGQDWDLEIRKAVRSSDIVVVCLSNSSINKTGYVQKEIRLALDAADEHPEGQIYVIPLRLEDCTVPDRLRKWQWVNLFGEGGYEKLLHALQAKARELDLLVCAIEPGPELLVLESPFHLELMHIPTGEFLMGSGDTEEGAKDNEKPQHKIHLDAYWIGKHEITVAQFAAFVGATGHETTAGKEHYGWDFVGATGYKTTAEKKHSGWNFNDTDWKAVNGADWQHPHGPDSNVSHKQDHPVTQVSWDDAVAFCQWLSHMTGRNVQLPTEAQWEKAARGTDGHIYPWGNEWNPKRLNSLESGVGDTTCVGSYSPTGDSPYGASDMSGNVWEWTGSLFRPYPYQSDDGREDVTIRGNRVMRGGSWIRGPLLARCTRRSGDPPSLHATFIGFRVAVQSIPVPKL